jgi:hypothetical protein
MQQATPSNGGIPGTSYHSGNYSRGGSSHISFNGGITHAWQTERTQSDEAMMGRSSDHQLSGRFNDDNIRNPMKRFRGVDGVCVTVPQNCNTTSTSGKWTELLLLWFFFAFCVLRSQMLAVSSFLIPFLRSIVSRYAA